MPEIFARLKFYPKAHFIMQFFAAAITALPAIANQLPFLDEAFGLHIDMI